MVRYEKLLQDALWGGLGGLIGTVVITIGMKGGPLLLQQLGLESGNEQQAEEPTEKLAKEVAIDLTDSSIGGDTKKVAGQAIHWGYGLGWGVLYGVVQSLLHLPNLLLGTLLGGLISVVASTAVPAMGLTPPPTRTPMSKNVMMMVLHLLYGWVTALTFRALSART
jgi:uncharacterized membrane protein YagU involved in acid resistance